MKVAIVGSRDYPDLQAVIDYVMALPEHDKVISGGARGVDTVAVETALKYRYDLDVEVFPALWEFHGKKAGMMRNIDIVNAADRVVAFWDGKSSGTGHTIRLARKAGKPVEVIRPDGQEAQKRLL